jgi:prepilin-type processing-associated H-X9-DG protein
VALMAKRFDKVYQFKVALQGIRPPIWRRIQVAGNYSFWDLHVAIQDAMGWWDSHLHGGSYDPRRFDPGKR